MKRLTLALFALLCHVSAFADGVAPAAQSPFSPLLMLVVFMVVFYFLLIRPQMKRNKDQRTLMQALAKGDEVITSSGFYGRIEKVDETTVDVMLADQVIVKMQKQAISSLLPKGTLK